MKEALPSNSSKRLHIQQFCEGNVISIQEAMTDANLLIVKILVAVGSKRLWQARRGWTKGFDTPYPMTVFYPRPSKAATAPFKIGDKVSVTMSTYTDATSECEILQIAPFWQTLRKWFVALWQSASKRK
jgi:hypothetical protein